MFSFTVIALSTATIILGSVSRPSTMAARSIAGRGMRWLGRHSYELYLFHIIVLGVMRDIVPGEALGTVWQIPWLLLFLLVSVAAAAGVARTVGGPANTALRRRLGFEEWRRLSQVPSFGRLLMEARLDPQNLPDRHASLRGNDL